MDNDGEWHLSTLGHFLGLLVDCKTGIEAVAYRITEEGPSNDNGGFVRTMEVTIYPNGSVVKAIEGTHTIHKTLVALIEGGIVT
ncbi:unnamed protein product [marine sediment metagenome]|uniref:Uncharacterized protein n=1 Tax=marine sediment metagenome TaxID=412755 RepID=X0UTM3_9ZZZZ